MYIWNVELVIRSEMCHSLYIGSDGQLQFAPHSLRGLTWLAEAHELRRAVPPDREYLEITVVRRAAGRMEATWRSTWHDVLVVAEEDCNPVCFGPRDGEGWRWTLSGDLRVRAVEDGWELWRHGDEAPSRYATWDDLADNWW